MINIITTGGTIDKVYCPISGSLLIGEPVIRAILAQANVLDFDVTEVMRKDSLDMTQSDREAIVAAVSESVHTLVLVTHGTDTMNETAQCLDAADLGKTLVLTGAMIPYNFPESDAAFNIGVAYCALHNLPAGVYIAMHGQVLPHAAFRKNRVAGKFELNAEH